jgi:type II secretory pathway component GspD/PulD (secretin)
VVCLNNQVSVIRIIQQQGYVASIQNTSVGGSTSFTAQQNTVTSTVTPGNVVTGLTLYLLPKIMKDKIFMQVNADFSTQIALVPFGPTNSQIQLPTVTMKHFNQRSMIRSGETLILSGFRQLTNIANANQVINSQALGGKASQELNKETIVLITPIILNSSGSA